MKAHLIAFVCGVLFSLGLVVGGMTQPAKVVGFLDLFGNWDPSLAFVMGGALMVNVIAFRLVKKKRETPLFDQQFHLPSRQLIDWRLVLGSALFGVGWGLSGFCPGPALTSLVTASAQVLTFVGFMALGIYGHTLFRRFFPHADERTMTYGGDGE